MLFFLGSLIFSKVFNSEDFSGRIFFRRCRGSRPPQEPQRRFRAQQVRRRRRRSGHGPSWACRIWLSGVLPKPLCLLIGFGKSFSNNIHNNEPPATLHYAVLTASLIYESQVRCQAHVSFGGTRRLIPPMTTFYSWWHPKMISPCLMVNIPSLKQL